MTVLSLFRGPDDTHLPLNHHPDITQILYAIARGDLRPETQPPSVRQPAVELSVNPNTIIEAYNELEIRGNLETRQGTTESSWRRSSKR